MTAVVNLAGGAFDDVFAEKGISYLNLRVEDTPQATLPIEQTLAFIHDHLDGAESDDEDEEDSEDHAGGVLVHCRGAHSRSLAICVAWLMQARQMSLATALERIKLARGLQNINHGFLQQLRSFEAKLERERQRTSRAEKTHDCSIQFDSI